MKQILHNSKFGNKLLKSTMVSTKLFSGSFMKFPYSNKEDQSHKLDYFKDKLANIPSAKKNKKAGEKLKDKEIEDVFKSINFENFDSSDMDLILNKKTQTENKSKTNNGTTNKANTYPKIDSKSRENEYEDNDKYDEILNYDFLNENKSLIGTDSQGDSMFLKDLENIIKDIKCKGCGIELQCTKMEKLGYVPEKKVKAYLGEPEDDNKKTNTNFRLEDLKLENIEIPKDTDYLKKLGKKNLKKSDLICERCFKLQNYMRLNDINDKSNKESEKPKSYEDKIKLDNYSLLIKKIDSQKLIQQIMIRLSSKSHVFYLCDISDFEPSVNLQIIKEIKNKNCGLTFMINKFDILPNDVNEERIRIWVGEKLKEMTSNFEGLKYNYILVSSKNGHNFDYVIHNIKNIKQKAKDNKIARPKIFLIGNANAGKSSFINKLIQTSNRFLTEERRKKKLYKKNYNITDPTLINLEKDPQYNNEQKLKENEVSDDSDIDNIEETKLTTSPLPGTTIGITKINSMTMGVKVFDTPGIPNLTSISYLMNNYINMISTFIIKKLKPYSMNIKQGYSIWLGALARIDMLNGNDKFFTFFLSHDVTIHRTFLLNAEKIFENQAGNLLRPIIADKIEDLNLVSHNFDLKCDKFNLLNYDICISGLGWFSISGKGFVQIDVSVPKGVKVYLRNKPLMPFEIKQGGVKKYFGNTINANSKLNKKMREEKKTQKD